MPITRPDGTEDFEQVPLTPEDVLHPEVGDFIVTSDAHNCDRGYFEFVCKTRLKRVPKAVVLSDCGVDWNIPGVKPLCPDVAVFFGVKRRIDWNIFDVKKEKAKPALVTEVTSKNTRKNDLGIKFNYYHQAKIPLYLIVDAVRRRGERRLKLLLYRYAPHGYELVLPDENGRVYLEPVNVWVGITHDARAGYERVICFDADTGKEFGDYMAVVEAEAAAQQKATAAEARAATAEARVRELETALKELRRNKP